MQTGICPFQKRARAHRTFEHLPIWKYSGTGSIFHECPIMACPIFWDFRGQGICPFCKSSVTSIVGIANFVNGHAKVDMGMPVSITSMYVAEEDCLFLQQQTEILYYFG